MVFNLPLLVVPFIILSSFYNVSRRGSSLFHFIGSSIFGQKPAFGASSTMGFGFSSAPSFGKPTMPAVSNSFLGTIQSPFGTQSSPSGGQARIPTFGGTGFGQSVSGGKHGSRVASYRRTAVVDDGKHKLVSVSAMPIYNDKSHEELRWEDYHSGDKGGSRVGTSTIHPKPFTPFSTSSSAKSFLSTSAFVPTSVTTPAPAFGPNSSPSLFGPSSSPAFASSPSTFNTTTPSSKNPFSSSIPSNPFTPQAPALTFPVSVPSTTAFKSPPIATSTSANSFWTTPLSIPSTSSTVATSAFGPNSSPSLFGPSSSPAFASSPSIFNTTTPSSKNPFSSSIPSNPFTPQTPALTFPVSVPSTTAFKSPPIATTTSANSFWTTPSSIPSTSSAVATSAFGPNGSVSLFGPSSSPGFSSSPSISSSTSAPGTAFVFEPNFFSSTSPVVASSPSSASTSSIFSSPSAPATNSGFSSGSSFAFTQSSPLFTSVAPSSNASFLPSKPNTINSPSTGSVFERNLFSCTPSQISTSTVAPPDKTNTSFSTPFQPAQTAPTSGSSGVGAVTGGIGQSTAAQGFVTQSTAEVQPPSVVNPFGTLPAIPQASIGRGGSTSSLQFGISSIPVSDKQATGRVSSLLTIRHLSQRRNRLPVQKYDPKSEGAKVPFFSDDHGIPIRARSEALFIPRENPRALVIRPSEQWPLRVNSEKFSAMKRTPIHGYENGQDSVEACAPVLNGTICQDEDGNSGENDTGKACATEAATVYEHSADLTALLPKLQQCSGYYTKPQIQDLASKDRAKPGFCSRVKDFVVGRHGFGSIKFLGETDVRQLDLESLIQFNNREVIVYPDESKIHPVGEGLNKPAEVTLLNIKCIDKRTGKQCIEGPKADKYREMLIKKAADQGAEFVSYNPVEGEWKFRVQHF